MNSELVTVPPPPEGSLRAMRLREVTQATGLSRSTIWRLRREGRFPVARRLSDGVIGWLETDVLQWIRARPFA